MRSEVFAGRVCRAARKDSNHEKHEKHERGPDTLEDVRLRAMRAIDGSLAAPEGVRAFRAFRGSPSDLSAFR